MVTPLCFHLLPNTPVGDWVSWASAGAPWVKVAGAADVAAAAGPQPDLVGLGALAVPPGAQCFYRPCYLAGDDGEGDCADGTAWGTIVVAELARAGARWPAAIGFRNELSPSSANAAAYLAYRAVLRAAGYPGLVVYGSFSTGRPDWPEYATIPPDVDALELHEYFGRTVTGSPDLALRHLEAIRRGLLSPTLPLFIGECGADDCGDGTGSRGWQQKMTAVAMAEQLATYRAGCAPSVLAAFVFADGDNGDPQWQSYATRGTAVEQTIHETWLKSRQDAPTGQGGRPVAALPIPLANQLAGDAPNRFNECGPACIRMVCDYLGVDAGESIDGIDVDETGSEQFVGYTTTQQMAAWFAARGLAAVQSQPPDMAAAITSNLERGWPCIWLGVWDRQAMTGGHFEVPVASDGQSITCNNPYGGYQETISAADVQRYSLGWLVTIQATKGDQAMDPTLQAAAAARFSALGVQPNTQGALFAAYARMVAAWLANGQDGVLDPTPVIKPEAVTPDGQHAYLLLDSSRILHWRKDTGLVYQAEAKERAEIFNVCGWGAPAA